MATLLPNDRISSHDLLGYRIFIYSHDHPHPAHVHFGKAKRVSSWDILTLKCVEKDGFDRGELRDQKRLLTRYRNEIMTEWHKHWKRHGQNRNQS